MSDLSEKLLKAIDRAIQNVSECGTDATAKSRIAMEATQSGMICGLMTAKEIIMIVDQDYSITKETEQHVSAKNPEPNAKNAGDEKTAASEKNSSAERSTSDGVPRRNRRNTVNRHDHTPENQ